MEWKTVIRKRFIRNMLLAVFCIHWFACIYWFLENKAVQEKGYINRYHQNIEAVLQQSDSMNQISIFKVAHGFSKRNIEKTADDYKKLLKIEPVSFGYQGLIAFFRCNLVHFFGVLSVLLAVIALTDRNAVGLKHMAYAARDGRGRRIFRKLLAIILWCMAVTAALYGSAFFISGCIYGTDYFSALQYPVQSIPIFMDVTYGLSIGEFLLLFLLYRCMFLVITALIVWSVYYFIDNVIIGTAVLGAMALAEVLLYSVIKVNSLFCILKYCNLWYQIKDNSFFSEYVNLNFFSYPVTKELISTAIIIIVCMILAFCSIMKAVITYPSVSRRFKMPFSSLLLLLQERLNSMGFEAYKLLVSQKGILLLLALLFVFIKQADFTDVIESGVQEMYCSFIERYEGVPTDASEQELGQLGSFLDALAKEYEQAVSDYEAGKIDDKAYEEIQYKCSAYQTEQIFYREIMVQRDYLKSLQEKRGMDGWYINLYCYNRLFKNRLDLQDFVFAAGMLLLVFGAFWEEKISRADAVLRLCKYGRRELDRKKAILLIGITVIMFAVENVLEAASIYKLYGISGLFAPVQSIPRLSAVFFRCNILQFMVLFFFLKLAVLLLLLLSAFGILKIIRKKTGR
ncbi:hypothetical protein D7V86_00655 [bacterium D16-51]|nr:hypothetical protein D7V96_04670 [bacterium D16-59]RKI62745.1 hypothetical protein D7V86_00655 [bacterium D16-51]